MLRRKRPEAAARPRGALSPRARLSGLLLAFAGAVLGASCGPPPPPKNAPPGHGWYCFSPHPRRWARLDSSCFRDKPACEVAFARATASQADAEGAGVADPIAPFHACAPAPIAWCFYYHSELIADPERHFVCTATACDCEREQTSGWTDIGVSRICDHAE